MLPNLRGIDEVLDNTRLIVRLDLDVPMANLQITDNGRLVKSVPTLKKLLSKGCRLVIIGHNGRPGGKVNNDYSLKRVYLEMVSLLDDGTGGWESVCLDDINDTASIDQALASMNLVFMENLRFWPGEESNNPLFLQNIVEITQGFVNDAFAVSHRASASTMLWQKLPTFYGNNFIEEVTTIGKLREEAGRPLTIILGGAKEDKVGYIEGLSQVADQVLVGGKLPTLISEEMRNRLNADKVIIGKLREDGLDITPETTTKFVELINSSKSIVMAGAMGLFENVNSLEGTVVVAKAVVANPGYKMAAGGDTGAMLVKFGLGDKMDFVSSGGGATLEYLIKGTLPAWG
ncbi:MAG: phosphoglycerate kinase [Candidatus Shapirobacteria bacterium]|jgi:phosphoglycerate kinase